jgi:hypothetical protein
LQELFKTAFDKENKYFEFSISKELKAESLNYLFSVDVTDDNTNCTYTFNCYVESCEDNTGVGLAIYYSDKDFFDFKRIEF